MFSRLGDKLAAPSPVSASSAETSGGLSKTVRDRLGQWLFNCRASDDSHVNCGHCPCVVVQSECVIVAPVVAVRGVIS